jgi:hypothetical protein
MSVLNQSAERSYPILDAWFTENDEKVAYLDFPDLIRQRESGITYCTAHGLDIGAESSKASFHRTGIIGGNVKDSRDPQIWLQLDGDASPQLFVLTYRLVHPLRVRRVYSSYNGKKSYLRDVRIVGYGISTALGLI